VVGGLKTMPGTCQESINSKLAVTVVLGSDGGYSVWGLGLQLDIRAVSAGKSHGKILEGLMTSIFQRG
jgi:hypothetical protein